MKVSYKILWYGFLVWAFSSGVGLVFSYLPEKWSNLGTSLWFASLFISGIWLANQYFHDHQSNFKEAAILALIWLLMLVVLDLIEYAVLIQFFSWSMITCQCYFVYDFIPYLTLGAVIISNGYYLKQSPKKPS